MSSSQDELEPSGVAVMNTGGVQIEVKINSRAAACSLASVQASGLRCSVLETGMICRRWSDAEGQESQRRAGRETGRKVQELEVAQRRMGGFQKILQWAVFSMAGGNNSRGKGG